MLPPEVKSCSFKSIRSKDSHWHRKVQCIRTEISCRRTFGKGSILTTATFIFLACPYSHYYKHIPTGFFQLSLSFSLLLLVYNKFNCPLLWTNSTMLLCSTIQIQNYLQFAILLDFSFFLSNEFLFKY